MLIIKKMFFLFIIVFVVSCQEDKNEIRPCSTQVSDLIDEDGNVTNTMIEILGQAGVRIKGRLAKKDWPAMMAELDSPHCEKVKDLIQGKDPRYPNYSWFAKPGVERWDMKYEQENIDQQFLIDLILKSHVKDLKGLNMGAATYPKTNSFSHILLLGSTLDDFKSRVAFIDRLISENYINTKLNPMLTILTGKRSFNATEKESLAKEASAEALHVLTADSEKVGLEWIFKYATKNDRFAALPFVTINDANPTGVRATTESTLILFFKQMSSPRETRILAVSTHIFALYQYLIAKRVAYQKGYKGDIEMCAPALIGTVRDAYPNSKKLAMLLDNLARIFYEICLYKEITGKYPS